ncbi:diguanylate cyclase [bacterium]|nr:MAG: diguanylate cyclase [bacterium]
MRDDGQLDKQITALLEDSEHEGHPLRAALEALFTRQQEQIAQLERLTSISDGYQTVLQQRNQSLSQRHQKQMRQLQKIVRISDHYQEMMRDLNEALKIASTQDPLTGLANRRLMLDRLKAEEALAKRRASPFSIAIIDVDHFKRINDTYGHDVGDTALTEIAHTLSRTLRAYDVCARWGGEEFMIVFPEAHGEMAQEIANRLRLQVNSLQLRTIPERQPFSVSIGIAEHRIICDVADTIKLADQALYAAKAAGRNCVMLAGAGNESFKLAETVPD